MKKAGILLLNLIFCLSLVMTDSAQAGEGIRIENGMAQPIVQYSDPWDPAYSNEESEILRFVVYVETDYDTDMDGMPDLIKTMVQLPRPAAEGVYAAPVIYEARPYIAGMYGYNPTLPPVGSSDFDEASLCTQPAKRVPQGSMTTLELAAAADASDWNYTLDTDPFGQQYLGNLTAYDDLLLCGFAVVQSAGLGTWGSEGVECCTSEMEAAAFRCVIEWLTGRRNAFTDCSSNIRIDADWSSGRIGMTGRSYAGAMAFELACSGVEGLETIVPVAAPASWYEYANSQGAPNGLLSSYDFIADLAVMCASRFFTEHVTPLRSTYEQYLARLRDEQIALAGDYGPFWEDREYSGRTVHCPGLIVHGLNDETVRPKQFELMRRAFLRSGCDVRVLLHQNGHVTPANEQTGTDIRIGEHTYTEWLNLWFTHSLLDVENDASLLPLLTVQSNLDGTFSGTDAWNDGPRVRLEPEDTQAHTVSAQGAHLMNYTLLGEDLDGNSGAARLLWRMDVPQDMTVCGIPEVHVRACTDDVQKNVLLMGAVLVDAADEAFASFETGAIGVLEQKVILEKGVDRGEGAEAYDLVEWKQSQVQRHLISYGMMDLRNPEAGYEPGTAVRRGEATEAGVFYPYTLYLQPSYYTVRAGHHLELYIVPFCGFSDEAALFDTNTAESLMEMGLDPDTMVPLTRDYAFTVDCSAGYAEIPVTTEDGSPVP